MGGGYIHSLVGIIMRAVFYTTRQVSTMLGVSLAAVRIWISHGDLPSVRVGGRGRHRIPADAVRRLAKGIRAA